MRNYFRNTTLLLIGIPLLTASIYFKVKTSTEDDITDGLNKNPDNAIVQDNNPIDNKDIKEEERMTFSFNNDVVTGKIVKGITYTKEYTITNIDKDAKSIALITSSYSSENDYLGALSNTQFVYVNNDIDGSISIGSEDNIWSLDTKIQGSSINSTLDYITAAKTTMHLSFIEEDIVIEPNKSYPIAILIPSKENGNDKFVSLKESSKDENLNKFNSEFTMISIAVFTDKDVNPLDYK